MALSIAKSMFAVLDDEDVDNVPQLSNPPIIKNGATSLPVSRKKRQLQKRAEKKEQLKNKKQQAPLNPEILRSKPLILPDQALAQQKLLRRPKPKPDATANGQGRAQQKIEAAKPPQLPQYLTLKEYEERLLEKKKGVDPLKKQAEERTLNLAKGFESMKLVGKKKEDSLSIKKHENIDKKLNKKDGKSVDGKKHHKSISINEFLKPVNDQRPSASNAHIKSTSRPQEEEGNEEAAPRINFGDFVQLPVRQNGARN